MSECNKEELDEAYSNNILAAKQKYEDYEAYKNELIAQLLLEGISINDPVIQNLFYSNDPLNL